jgi:hypothetical protein
MDMRRTTRWFRLPFAPVLMMALWFGACSDQGTPSEQLLGPEAKAEKSLSLSEDLWKLANGQPMTQAGYGRAVIGSQGGSLYVDAHYLVVPPGAVDGPTLFEMTVRTDGRIGAKMQATSVDANGVPSADRNNVGRRGFKRAAYLTFYYGYATNFTGDPRQIKLLWLRPDGTKVPQPTYVYPQAKIATGLVTHFSDYAIGFPNLFAD